MTILVTGTAGFIGNAVALRLLARGEVVVGIDNLNDYYERSLKLSRLERLKIYRRFSEISIGLEDREEVEHIFHDTQPKRVIHLAAQPGVRFSIENPYAYIESNIVAFLNVLEGCRHHGVDHFVYASSSSVYGASMRIPFSEHHSVDHPLSLYGATKKADELMAHVYSHLYDLPTTGLRFFTVYGPWGRPDMAPMIFVRRILAGEPLNIFNHGHHRRDFTYIDDIVEGVLRVLDRPPLGDATWSGESPTLGASSAKFRVYNIGAERPVPLMRFIELLEENLGKKAKRKYLPMQPGDIPDTYADISQLKADFGYKPVTSIEEGISKFIIWYRHYYGI